MLFARGPPTEEQSFAWRTQFIRTFLTRDIPQLGISIPSEQLRRFWLMIAHYHGQVWNASEIAGSLGLNYKTAQRYLDILTGAFLVRQVQPWVENVGKRVRKAPKIYLRDSGLFHALMGLGSMRALESHPKLGASWEGLLLEQAIRLLRLSSGEVFYRGTHAGAELDLFAARGGRRFGFEFEYRDAPKTTPSMRSAVEDLQLNRLFVIYPGDKDYSLSDAISVIGATHLERIPGLLAPESW